MSQMEKFTTANIPISEWNTIFENIIEQLAETTNNIRESKNYSDADVHRAYFEEEALILAKIYWYLTDGKVVKA